MPPPSSTKAGPGSGGPKNTKSRSKTNANAVSTNFIRNDYRKNSMRHGKRHKTMAGGLGRRFKSGQLRSSRYKTKGEWLAERKEQANERLYHDLLTTEELENVLHETSVVHASTLRSTSALPDHGTASNSTNSKQSGPIVLSALPSHASSSDDRILKALHADSSLALTDAEARERAELEMFDQELAAMNQNEIQQRFFSNSNGSGSRGSTHSDRNSNSSSSSSRSNSSADAAASRLSSFTSPTSSSSSDDLHHILRTVFGFTRFNRGQEDALRMVLSRKSTLLVLPTGGGKSLCYQLPAYVFPGVTLVVTPLISLMQDQLDHLPACVPGAVWNSALSPDQTHTLMQRLQRGEVKVLFVSPEKVLTPGFQRFMTSSLPPAGVSFACVDEAHCVSEWSHCFRPSYLRLTRILYDVLHVCAVLALTATATKQTQSALCRALRIPDEHVQRSPVNRRNLVLTASKDQDRLQALVGLLRSDLYRKLGSIIVYVTTQMETEIVAKHLVRHANAIISIG